MLYKKYIFHCMGNIFCVEFQRFPLKFHTKCFTYTLRAHKCLWNAPLVSYLDLCLTQVCHIYYRTALERECCFKPAAQCILYTQSINYGHIWHMYFIHIFNVCMYLYMLKNIQCQLWVAQITGTSYKMTQQCWENPLLSSSLGPDNSRSHRQ